MWLGYGVDRQTKSVFSWMVQSYAGGWHRMYIYCWCKVRLKYCNRILSSPFKHWSNVAFMNYDHHPHTPPTIAFSNCTFKINGVRSPLSKNFQSILPANMDQSIFRTVLSMSNTLHEITMHKISSLRIFPCSTQRQWTPFDGKCSSGKEEINSEHSKGHHNPQLPWKSKISLKLSMKDCGLCIHDVKQFHEIIRQNTLARKLLVKWMEHKGDALYVWRKRYCQVPNVSSLALDIWCDS